MGKIIPSLIVLLFAVPVRANEGGGPVPWAPGPADPRVVVGKDGVLEIAGAAGPTTTILVSLDKPQVPSHHYRLIGRIKYENVQGAGHLEMWSNFPGGGAFFTKTLEERGPLGLITGSSDWRDLELPFFSKPGMLPEKITVALVLPQGGKVYLTPLRLTTAAEGFFPGLLGAALGTGIGLLGGLIGVLASFQGSRRLAYWLLLLCMPTGVLLAIAGLVLLQVEQFKELCYPLVLSGGILAVVAVALYPTLKRRLAEDEARRMQALDA